jgi:hypothetical protein
LQMRAKGWRSETMATMFDLGIKSAGKIGTGWLRIRFRDGSYAVFLPPVGTGTDAFTFWAFYN